METIRDRLLKLGEDAQEGRLQLDADAKIYANLIKQLPSFFPVPDECYTKTTIASDYDVAMIYALQESENPESLRLVVALMLGISDWDIEIDKVGEIASLRALKRYENLVLLVKLIGVDPKQFRYIIDTDTGTVVSGPAQFTGFAPMETLRVDANPNTFLPKLQATSYHSYVASKQAFIYSLAAFGVDTETPMPDKIETALGLKYDVDLTYNTDLQGRIRLLVDKTLGYVGWASVVDKVTGKYSMHTIVPVVCTPDYTLKIRVNITKACRNKEQLFLAADLSDRLVYRATRRTDPDHHEVIENMRPNERI
jgi:hypothetical protein